MPNYEAYRQQLEQERERIQKELSSIATQTTEGTWDSTHPQYNTDDNLDLENETGEVEAYVNRLPMEQNFEKRLAAIDKALERIANGVYGICVNCGKPIPEKRLEVMPEAERCLDCQAR